LWPNRQRHLHTAGRLAHDRRHWGRVVVPNPLGRQTRPRKRPSHSAVKIPRSNLGKRGHIDKIALFCYCFYTCLIPTSPLLEANLAVSLLAHAAARTALAFLKAAARTTRPVVAMPIVKTAGEVIAAVNLNKPFLTISHVL